MRELPLDRSDIRFGKWLVIVNGAVPAMLLAWDGWHGRLGANPANFAIRTTGFLALIFLVASLVVTPAMRWTGQSWLGTLRRALGLYAFFHAAAHFGLFFWLDRNLVVSDTLSEMWKRKYLLVGSAGVLLMIPLAVTSTNGMIRRLGAKRWKQLHRLAYVAAIAGVAHYYMLQKADVTEPLVYASVLGGLLGWRGVTHYRNLRSAAGTTSLPRKPAFWRGVMRVVAVFDETHDVRTFRLAMPDGAPLPFDYKPGQYLNVLLTVDGKPVRRSYTIASTPTRVGSVEITVKREAMGVSSGYLHRTIKVGDEVTIAAPAGRFVFDGAQADSIVMIAGGVGITPLMSKIRYLTDTSWPGRIDLVYSARTAQDIIFASELRELSSRHANLHVTVTLTRADDRWTGERGRCTAELLRRVVPEIEKRRVHICGPTEMADATRALLRSMGVPEDRIATESFTSSRRSDGEANPTTEMTGLQQEQIATFERSGRSVTVAAGQVLLEAAESAGISVNFDCRSGVCGQCKVKLFDGAVAMESDAALTPADRAAGLILACQARCQSDVRIDA